MTRTPDPRPHAREKSFLTDFRMFFGRGLGIVLPTVLTLALLLWAFGFLRNNVAEPINGAVRRLVVVALPRVVPSHALPEWFLVSDEQIAERHGERARSAAPRVSDATVRESIRTDNFRDWWQHRWYMQAIGFVVAVVIVYLAGLLVGNLIGRSIYLRFEALMTRLPLLKQVYPSVKQVVEFLVGSGGEQKLMSNRVVAVEYPRRGIWSLGLLTGETMNSIQSLTGVECVTVFIPSSPTPFTGYTITIPRDEVYELPVTLDDALRFVVSGGVLVPPSQSSGKGLGVTVPSAPSAPGRAGAHLAESGPGAKMGGSGGPAAVGGGKDGAGHED
ncbi:MAG TPA: hypothetical protein DEB06_07650 [Phycisphaerales bacterium]|nr:hypothetical protein [Phycisphaerales bacterium]